MPDSVERLAGLVLAALVCLQLGACATQPTAADGSKPARSPADPWEPLNRPIHTFNAAVDGVSLRLLAKGYQKVVPAFMRRGVGNFSRNLRAPLHIINNFLQGKIGSGFKQTGRFVMNTTFGIGGLMDVAADAGIDVEIEDFGQTLAVWGVPDGPFVSIPFFGPRTLRDATMIPLNFLADPLLYYDNASVRDKVYLVRLIDVRARLLPGSAVIRAAYDPYLALREAYLQHRRYLIYDGDPPEDDDFYEEFLDEEEEFPEEE
ncbi:MAG: VacJ family lipoprotein [Proteobacteria bacterium]|nr:VacJ family lipoprotein [Pseudomonadota bacterium]